jgi:preprotein translocase subunit YajC
MSYNPFINVAIAAENANNITSNPAVAIIPYVVVAFIFYFFMIRPQQKKYKEFQGMLNSLKVGDKIATSGGIIGIVSEIDNAKQTVVLTANKGVEILVYKKAISEILLTSNNAKETAN